MNPSDALPDFLRSAAAASALTARMNACEPRFGGSTGAAAGAPGVAAAANAAGAPGAAAGAAAAAPAATSAGGFQSDGISCLKPTWRWFWWAPSVK